MTPPSSTTRAASRSWPTCRAGAATVWSARRSRLSSTSPTGARPGPRWPRGTGPASWCRYPTGSSPGRWASTFPAPALTRRAWSSCPPRPTTPPRRGAMSRSSPGPRACGSWAGATCRSSPTAWVHRRAGPCRVSSRWRCPGPRPVTGRRRATKMSWRSTVWRSVCASASNTRSTACTSCPCRRAPWSTRACSPGPSSTNCSPTCRTRPSTAAWRSCTRGSRRTPSRRGRWPIPTGTWPTTARSTRCGATATGCAPARPCCAATSSPGTSSACSRCATRTGATRPPSTRCSSCCTSGGAPWRTPCS